MSHHVARAPLALSLALAALAVSGCQSAADLSCDEIARQAQGLSESQPVRFSRITDVREVSRTEAERRCVGTAETTEGQTGTVYLRGYQENGNQMVGYSDTPFD